jgi:hypothetical protein
LDVASVKLDFRIEADGAEDAVEGVADMFEFGVEVVAAVLEPILEAFAHLSK